MLTASDLDTLAGEVKTAQDSAQQVQPFTMRVPGFDLSVAYKVAQLVHSARLKEGAKPVGRKVGFTNPEMWSRYGVREPIWAYVYDTTVIQLQGTHATCSLKGFVEPKIEPEIVFCFRTVPQPRDSLLDLLRAIDWVAHGFEIVQSHFPGWKFEAPDTVADCALHGTLLVGPPRPLSALGPNPIDALASFSLALSRDARHIETGRGQNVLGSPLAAVAHLLSVLEGQGGRVPLRSGEIVTTGTVTMAQSVHAGEVWRSEVREIALPGLTIEFE